MTCSNKDKLSKQQKPEETAALFCCQLKGKDHDTKKSINIVVSYMDAARNWNKLHPRHKPCWHDNICLFNMIYM